MRGPKPTSVELTEPERAALERLVKRHTTSQQLVLRSRIVLAAADGLNNSQVARRLDVSVHTARVWRQRWLRFQAVSLADLDVPARLADLPRPGAPGHITAEQLCQIVALACEAPADSGRPITQWTQRELAEEIITRRILPRISPRHAGRLLKISRAQAASESLLADPQGGCAV
jgi:putative transposase